MVKAVFRYNHLMRQYDTDLDSLETIHAALTARDAVRDAQVEATVRAILDDVKARGDAAVLEYTRRYDWPKADFSLISLTQSELVAQFEKISSVDDRAILASSTDNILDFHRDEKGHLQSWMQISSSGGSRVLGQLLQPVKRVGIYVPGGKAAYPSTVLMTAIPASVAGVAEIIVCTPPDLEGNIHPLVGHAASRWVSQLFKIGGAQAIAAMAFGTETVPKCDVIVGPGNAYVNIAKKLVYGEVGIDMLAGPSEVAIIADEHAKPSLIAADLLAQTEHGHDNRGFLFCHSSAILECCKNEIAKQRENLLRKEILAATFANLVFVKTNSLEQSLSLSNILAPEHLEIMVREPLAVLPFVKNAGAVLLGDHTSAPIGDYWAGPSHTLPTSGAARFSSPLSVATFMKRTSVLYYSQNAAEAAANAVARFAELEGFDGHAAAARMRGSSS